MSSTGLVVEARASAPVEPAGQTLSSSERLNCAEASPSSSLTSIESAANSPKCLSEKVDPIGLNSAPEDEDEDGARSPMVRRLERSNSCSTQAAGEPAKPALERPFAVSQSQGDLSRAAGEPDQLEAHESAEEQVCKPAECVSRQPVRSSRFFSSKLNTGSLWSLLSAGSGAASETSPGACSMQSASKEASSGQQQQQVETSSQGFFFKRAASSFKAATSKRSPASQQQEPQAAPASQAQLIGFRFNLKYMGSTMLHRNFTPPMLEWVAKDIKRQTVRGAQVVSKRQFTIPSRDIVLELQPAKLTGVSAKDHKHCLFVHPMHCVSKYAQLQHDPTSFAYLIRDRKDAPTFCHVFQAKSAKKVHDIFSAIREIAAGAGSAANASRPAAGQLNRSASVDVQPARAAGELEHELHAQRADFENSYQFEVMFVKKVKLQCRRVPASFVDDALETLRSFELLKAHHESKASHLQARGKHVISATVDERQEYDEGAGQAPNEPDRRKSNDELKLAPVRDQPAESRSCQASPTKLSLGPDHSDDFSPYNTITSSDLNERIAAMPLVSSSVSLDEETRRRLARQVRETIQATAASLNKPGEGAQAQAEPGACSDELETQRRASSTAGPLPFRLEPSSANNFDLFRRASGRQNIKNRTVLLLIGKDELCTISIDKHQLLFSKSFNSIVHCLQGSNNKDHFGLICRDSPKLNPSADSYAGLIFKCQSEKVVREIMGALKQVIYSSQHNYHGLNSPYNPLNSSASASALSSSPSSAPVSVAAPSASHTKQADSLAGKRGFLAGQLDLRHAESSSTESLTAPVLEAKPASQQAKNPIKSMFCDNCPLYWFHRLCCDVESLPAEASKAIILRRIDSSLSEREQDEIYSRFAEFHIESIEEHNEIFMSLLRHLCERQQSKHSQLSAHLAALAKNNPSNSTWFGSSGSSGAFGSRSLSQVQQPPAPTHHHHQQQQPPAPRRTRQELRELWQKVILEQITLLKMDKQNQKLQMQARQESSNHEQRQQHCVKLNYRDFTFCSRELLSSWQRLLSQNPRLKVDFGEVVRLLRAGVPKQRRGEIWMFLMNQYQLRHGTSFQPADSEYTADANQSYRDLLSRLSVQQHEIFVDIGRTFPNHPYYSQYLSIGQLSLFNLLKAYSLLDPEVGYCQGLSFVAGILLLHVDGEDEAFELMRHLLFNFGLRKQYLPSMRALQLQLYQISRLLRDFELQLFAHFDRHEISPSLYAAPWFLTLFANQFPLAFVARLLDLIFLIGIEAIFRVSLNLLAFHRASILECQSLEATMEYMRGDSLVNRIDDKSLIKLFEQAMSMDLRNKLIEYEIEYTFYCAEDRARTGQQGGAPEQQQQHLAEAQGEQRESSANKVADVTADLIIQHLLANNHLKTVRSKQRQHQQ